MAEIFERATHERLRETFGGWLPARIDSYNSTTNRARIQILIYDDYEDEEGERKIEAFPALDDVPVGWLSLAGRFCFRSTVAKGDEGIYMMPARPTAKWMQTGGMVDPEDDDHHPLDGGVFLPYRVSVGGRNADPMIEITASEVKIGGNNSLVTTDEFNNHTHAVATTGTASAQSGTAAIPTPVLGTQKLKGG
jgi:hypothetical protein